MKKLILLVVIATFSSVVVFAQDDHKKAEFFVGYSNSQVDSGIEASNSFGNFIRSRESYHGANVSAVYNISRYFGIKADFSAAYNKRDFRLTVPPGGTLAFDTKNSLYNALGGIQVKDNSAGKRFKPFAYALIGAGHGRTRVKNVVCPTGVSCAGIVSGSETGLAGAFGGGLDIKLTDHVDFRVVQVDYNPIKFNGGVQQNVRIGIGFVFK
ncbi:MAG TPA: outer membrane beta-barrel protein [Pyrinomonadaceae bacterium]|nr:outer membrane beta-barrel protein [Pyrinomonadaceae bacterium]